MDYWVVIWRIELLPWLGFAQHCFLGTIFRFRLANLVLCQIRKVGIVEVYTLNANRFSREIGTSSADQISEIFKVSEISTR
jgi:hypothetical protein